MKKLVIAAMVLSIPVLTFAEKSLYKNIKIVKNTEMRAGGFTIPESFLKETENKMNQMKAKGYVDHDSTYPRRLLNMGFKGVTFGPSQKYEDSDLKKSSNEVKLAFPYSPPIANSIAFAPIGMLSKDGWTGIKEFFSHKEIGTCEYSLSNMELAQGSVEIDKNVVRYDVNNKPTTIMIEGNVNSGFMYSINWFDDKYDKQLRCANMDYKPELRNKIIELAKMIDNK